MRVNLDGLRTEWFDEGQGTTLLCFHPLGQEAAFHRGLADALGHGWRVVSYDQRGHGAATGQPPESWAQLVADAAVASSCIEGDVHLAGFSMGGSVAATLAARQPGRFASLTLAATPLKGTPVFSQRARAVISGGLDGIEAETLARWFGESQDDAAITRARASLRKLTPEGFDAAWRAFSDFDGYGQTARGLPPTLVLSFADDLSTPPAILDEIATVIRDAGVCARRVSIEGAGHMGLLERPGAVADRISDFIGDIS